MSEQTQEANRSKVLSNIKNFKKDVRPILKEYSKNELVRQLTDQMIKFEQLRVTSIQLLAENKALKAQEDSND